jgi:hypothetical protein
MGWRMQTALFLTGRLGTSAGRMAGLIVNYDVDFRSRPQLPNMIDVHYASQLN